MSGSLVVASIAIAGIKPFSSNFGAKSVDSSIWALSLRSENGLGDDMAGKVGFRAETAIGIVGSWFLVLGSKMQRRAAQLGTKNQEPGT